MLDLAFLFPLSAWSSTNGLIVETSPNTLQKIPPSGSCPASAYDDTARTVRLNHPRPPHHRDV